MTNTIKNPCFIYTILWCFYLCQGVLYANDSVFSKGAAMLILLLSIVYSCKYVFSNFPLVGYPKALFGVLVLVSVYGFVAFVTEGSIIHGKEDDTRLFAWFRYMYLSILPIFTYMYFAKKEWLSMDFIRKLLPLMALSVLCAFWWSYKSAVGLNFGESADTGEEVTNNAGYVALTLLPTLLVYNNKKVLQYLGLLFVVVLVCLAMKRGAILICGIMTLLFIGRDLKQSTSNQRLFLISLSIAFGFLLILFVQDYLLESAYFIERIDNTIEGNSSGRNDVYSTLWNHFINEDSPLRVLFGGGVWYTTKVTWTAAHNDWLEFLLDMGILGVIVYIFYWIAFARLCNNKQLPNLSRFCILLLLIDLFMRTIFSMSIHSMSFMHGMMIGIASQGQLKSDM